MTSYGWCKKKGGLPDLAALACGPDHGVALFAVKGLCEFRHVRQRPVHSEPREGVRIGFSLQLLELRPGARCPYLGVCQKESLFCREPVYVLGVRLALERLLKRFVGYCKAAQVGDALARDQLPVLMQVALNDEAIELMDHALGSLFEVLQVLG